MMIIRFINYSSASPMVMLSFVGGVLPTSHFWTYRVPMAGGLPLASSEYRIVFFVSLSRVKVRVCFPILALAPCSRSYEKP
jgi:hypothetical protein